MKKIFLLLSLISMFSANAAELNPELQEKICNITAKGLVGDVAVFLSENPLYIKAKNRQGADLMHIAASTGNIKLTKFIKKQGLSFQGIDAIGNTVLHYANTNTIKPCLTAKIDVNCTNFLGQTPLHVVCTKENTERKTASHVAEELIRSKANIDALDNKEETPLSLAIQHNKPQIITLLLASNADPNLPNSRGETPIEFLRRSPACESLEELFKSPSDHFKPWRQVKADAEKLEAQEKATMSAQVDLMLEEMRDAEAKAAKLANQRRHSI